MSMKRVTRRASDGSIVFPPELVGLIPPDNPTIHTILTRLADYEDSNLTPKQFAARKVLYDEGLARTYGPMSQRVAELINEDQAGRVMALPCKMGETWQRKTDGKKIKVLGFQITPMAGVTVICRFLGKRGQGQICNAEDFSEKFEKVKPEPQK